MSPLGQYVVQTAVTLVGIAVLAWLIIGFGRRVGLPKNDGVLRLRARLALDARRCIYLVEVGDRVLVLGAGEGGIRKLAELPGNALPEPVQPAKVSFSEVLARVGVGAGKLDREPDAAAPVATTDEESR
jgi:flagellar biogenesis protein FliO